MADNGVKLRGCLEVSGAVSESIVSVATRVSADLIVLEAGSLTSSRATGVTSQAVMAHAEQLVLVIHPDSRSPEFHTTLCPVDHSSVSRRGLRNAIFLARMLRAQLIWLSVILEVSWLTAAAESDAHFTGVPPVSRRSICSVAQISRPVLYGPQPHASSFATRISIVI